MNECARDRVCGPLAGCAAGFTAELERLGYSRTGVLQQLGLLADLSGWLDAEAMAPAELTAGQVDRFLGGRGRRHRDLRTGVGAGLLLGYLAGLGVIPAQTDVPEPGPCGAVLEDYRRYLASERGLTGPEVTRHVRTARMFAEHARAADRGWAAVTAADVTGFAVAQCAELGRASACKRISQLRSFLRYAHLSGLTAALAPAIPSAASWSATSLPRWLPPGQVAALLAACDQRTARGRRDFAMVTLLSRLGLRAGEVAALRLDDIDWRAGTLTVRGKCRREEKMPLTQDVGQAIVGYLADGRPAAECRLVFLRSKAPRQGLSAHGVSGVVAAAASRAGLPRTGAHRLRHSAGTAMLRSGASLEEVGQVLRQRSPATTAIYAKVDHAALAQVARPWPGGAA